MLIDVPIRKESWPAVREIVNNIMSLFCFSHNLLLYYFNIYCANPKHIFSVGCS